MDSQIYFSPCTILQQRQAESQVVKPDTKFEYWRMCPVGMDMVWQDVKVERVAVGSEWEVEVAGAYWMISGMLQGRAGWMLMMMYVFSCWYLDETGGANE
jgi:hypothetical protein